MKKYMVLLAVGIFLQPLVFTASNKAKIEKLDPGSGDNHPGASVLVVEHSFSIVSRPDDLVNLNALIPEQITLEPGTCQFAEWMPWGEVNTKYHAAWLFHPLKLC
jgi:hypothetical protein